MQRIGVVRGGISKEYDISLASGGEVISALRKCGMTPVDIFISKDGQWHSGGLPIAPEDIPNKVDCIWNALHGDGGEDGTLSAYFESRGIPVIGSGYHASEALHNKIRAKELFKQFDIKTPQHEYMPEYNETLFPGTKEEYAARTAQRVWQSFPPPWVIKPLASGSSVGVMFAKTFSQLEDAVLKAVVSEGDWMIEEYIQGREISVGIVEGLRGKKHYTLIPNEILKKDPVLFYDERMYGTYEARPLPHRDATLKEKLVNTMTHLFEWLGIRHHAVGDFVVTPRGIYLLEIDTIPAFHQDSLFVRNLADTGITLTEFVQHQIDVAKNRK